MQVQSGPGAFAAAKKRPTEFASEEWVAIRESFPNGQRGERQAQSGAGAFAAAEKGRLNSLLKEELPFGKVCRMAKGAKCRFSPARAPVPQPKNAD